ncbi:MAG TPA: hypothetical protein VEO95_06510, partial [Chthoniobacteraceae bacterium]|nr:hypothetical protein [Chthoniobacteraceae bacterium]
KEKIALAQDAADTIARGAEGGLRDAESMLDQLVSFCGEKIDEADVLKIFGFTSAHTTTALVDHIIAGDAAPALALIHEQAEAGKDLSRLMADLIAHLRNLLVIQCDPNGASDELSTEAVAALAEQSARITRDKLLDLIEQFADAEAKMKWAPNKKMHFEVAAIRAIQTLNQATLTDVLETLTALRGGAPSPAKAGVRSQPAATATAAPQRRSLSEAVAATLNQAKPAGAAAPTPTKIAEEPDAAPTAARGDRGAVVSSAAKVESAAPPLAAESAPISAAELWPQLVARVRKERPLIQGWVEAGQLVEVTRDTAVLAFPPDQGLALEACERANNRKFLEALIGELAGRALAIGCETRAGLTPEKIAIPETKPEPPPDPMALFKDDPLIQKALAEFKAEIVPA